MDIGATQDFKRRMAHGTLVFSEKRDHPRRASHGILVERLEVSNQAGETALVCERLYPVERREAASAQ